MKNKWEIVHDCDSEDGEITCWSKKSIIPNMVNLSG
jgi:hypothetical protein